MKRKNLGKLCMVNSLNRIVAISTGGVPQQRDYFNFNIMALTTDGYNIVNIDTGNIFRVKSKDITILNN